MAELGTVVIGGGTGFIGSYLSRMLRRKGYGIVLVSRMPGPLSMSWSDLQKNGLPASTTAVINLAGQNVLDPKQRWTPGFKQNVYSSRINTTSALASAISKACTKPDVFISISGVGIYKPHQITDYTEVTDVMPYDYLSSMCVDWENAAKLPANVKCRQVTIRSGVVLGRHGGMIKQLYLPFYLGLGGPVLPGTQWLPWIHIGDLCRLIIYCIENKKVNGILNGVAPHLISNSDFSEYFAKAMKRPYIIPVPQFVMNFIFGPERASMITKGQRVIPERTLSVGFKHNFPDIESACLEIVNCPSQKNME